MCQMALAAAANIKPKASGDELINQPSKLSA